MKQINCIIAFNKNELKQIFELRREIFVSEQNVPQEIEMDEHDKTATHVAAVCKGQVIGCGRLIVEDGYAKVGRLAVKKCFRGQGVGRCLMHKLVELSKSNHAGKICLNAQVHAVPFYKELGFVPKSDIFLEAGIEHIAMELLL